MAVVLAAVFLGCLATVYVVHRMLLAHQRVLAALIARRAADLTWELGKAEERIAETARTGLRARNGPARLRDHA